VLDAAYGVHRLANATMMRAVKAVSTYRGRDPRDFTLFAFGGNGGVHAVELARELQMRRVIVPPGAGVFSAVGLLFADIEVARSAAYLTAIAAAEAADVALRFRQLEASVVAELDDKERATVRWRADLRYAGQGFELGIEVTPGPLAAPDLAAIQEAFEQEHERTYGHRLAGRQIDFVTLRVIGTVAHRGPSHLAAATHSAPNRETRRPVYFGPAQGLRDTPVIGRGSLGVEPVQGPLVIEEYEGTTVVPPDATASRDIHNNIIINL
jgi:N-methylhydantoinase A